MLPERQPARNFSDLLVWQRAHQFVLAVYRATSTFPAHEKFGLTIQLRRASVSIAANIAEAFGKRTRPDKARFLNIAEGSLEESRYFLILASDLGYGETTSLTDLLNETARLLCKYAQAVRAS